MRTSKTTGVSTMTVSPNMISMNKYDTQLRDLIHVEKGIIPANLCEYLVEEIEKNGDLGKNWTTLGTIMLLTHLVLKKQWNWMCRILPVSINNC